jgi:RHS repeat-associated protein
MLTSNIYTYPDTSNLNRIGSTNAPGMATTPLYDDAGNMTFDGKNHFAYDAENHVCGMVNDTGTLTQYLYNVDGKRVAKGHSKSGNALACPSYGDFAADEKYILGQNGENITELVPLPDGTDHWKNTNVYSNGQLLATYDQEGPQLLHFNVTDPLGTKRVQASASGAPELSWMNLPFGDALTSVGSGQDATQHHFTGKERDTESGLDYFGARSYSSNMGRWMSPDPSGLSYADIANPQSFNLYSYVLNNPLTNIDPNGLDCVYFNNSGDAAESIDHNSNSDECGQHGGDWVNGTTQMDQVHYNQASDNFSIKSWDTNNNYNTVANSPGSQQDGADCYGNCSVGYFESSKIDPLNSSAQGVIGGVAQQTGSLLNIGNRYAGHAGCAALAGGKAFQSFFGLPANMQNGPPGASTALRAVRGGVEAGASATAYAAGRVGGAVAAKFAEDAIPVAGQVLLAGQAVLAGYDAVKFFHQCDPNHQ